MQLSLQFDEFLTNKFKTKILHRFWDFHSKFPKLVSKVIFLRKLKLSTITKYKTPMFLTLFLVKSKWSKAKKCETTSFLRISFPFKFRSYLLIRWHWFYNFLKLSHKFWHVLSTLYTRFQLICFDLETPSKFCVERTQISRRRTIIKILNNNETPFLSEIRLTATARDTQPIKIVTGLQNSIFLEWCYILVEKFKHFF